MLVHRVTGSLLLGLAAVCGYLGFERMRDFADFGGAALRDLGFAAAWWLLLAGCLIAAVYDFQRSRRQPERADH